MKQKKYANSFYNAKEKVTKKNDKQRKVKFFYKREKKTLEFRFERENKSRDMSATIINYIAFQLKHSEFVLFEIKLNRFSLYFFLFFVLFFFWFYITFVFFELLELLHFCSCFVMGAIFFFEISLDN